MFYCPEIDLDTAYTRWAKWGLTVAYKTGDYSDLTIDASIADGNYSGRWNRLKHTVNNNEGTAPAWYISAEAAKQYGTFAVNSTASKTIAELSTALGITIDNLTGISGSLNWTVTDIIKLYSDYFFIVYTPAGLSFLLPKGIGTDRGIVYNEDVEIRTTFDKVFNYSGESTGDIFISSMGDVQPSTITSTYKQLAVNKAKAASNIVVYTSGTLCKPGDYISTADGVKYVVLHGETVGSGKYRYTAVLEVTDSLTFAGSDVQPLLQSYLNACDQSTLSDLIDAAQTDEIITTLASTWAGSPSSGAYASVTGLSISVPAGTWNIFADVRAYAWGTINILSTTINNDSSLVISHQDNGSGYMQFPFVHVLARQTLTATTTFQVWIMCNYSTLTGLRVYANSKIIARRVK